MFDDECIQVYTTQCVRAPSALMMTRAKYTRLSVSVSTSASEYLMIVRVINFTYVININRKKFVLHSQKKALRALLLVSYNNF